MVHEIAAVRGYRGAAANPLLTGIAFVGLGLAVFACGVWSRHRYAAARQWPTVEGVVDNSSYTTSHSRKGGTTYRCSVNYHFNLNSVPYKGDNMVATGSYSGSRAWSLSTRYHSGAPCVVHYDPSDPSLSCLEVDESGDGWIWLLLGGVFLVTGAGSVFRGIFWQGR